VEVGEELVDSILQDHLVLLEDREVVAVALIRQVLTELNPLVVEPRGKDIPEAIYLVVVLEEQAQLLELVQVIHGLPQD
jgi:hypothetical protein